ncbi:MAG: flagellar export chaperone FliS [Gammaproteobacteria bacterium]|nr:flagellar export chaperone FliS [Gammaproteobacteria bacterium]
MSIKQLKQYENMATQSGVVDANPHRLIQMLMEGALEKIAKAKGFLQRENVEAKGAHITWAIRIIQGLRDSLDMDKGADLSERLDGLYEYMIFRLVEANAENSIEKLDEVTSLMANVKEGWDGIADEAKQIFSNSQPRQAFASV